MIARAGSAGHGTQWVDIVPLAAPDARGGGVLRRNEGDEWSLTPRIYRVGMMATRNVDVLVVGQPILRQLVDRTGLAAHPGIPEYGRSRAAA